jgi:hypothetical protein
VMSIQPGSFVSLRSRPSGTYQVLNVDPASDHVWLRRWPLGRTSNPSFAAPLADLLADLEHSEAA